MDMHNINSSIRVLKYKVLFQNFDIIMTNDKLFHSLKRFGLLDYYISIHPTC